MTPDRPPRFAPPRGLAIGGAVVLVIAMLFYGWGAVTPGAVASLTSPSGGAVLTSMAIDTTLNVAVVGLWTLAAFGMECLVARVFNPRLAAKTRVENPCHERRDDDV